MTEFANQEKARSTPFGELPNPFFSTLLASHHRLRLGKGELPVVESTPDDDALDT